MLVNFFHGEAEDKPKRFPTILESHVATGDNISYLLHFLYAFVFGLVSLLGRFAEDEGYLYVHQDQTKKNVPTPKNNNVPVLGF